MRKSVHNGIRHYRALKASKNDSFDTVLIVILQQKLDDRTRLKWAEFSNDCEVFVRVLNCLNS